MSTAVSIYIFDHTPSGQSRLYKHKKFSVHGTVSNVVFQNIPGVRCTTAVHHGPVFAPPDLYLSTCKGFIVRYKYHMLSFKT